MRIKGLLTITVVLFSYSLTGLESFAQRRGPSTPKERGRVVQMARDFEANPLSEEAKNARLWFVKWIKEVPDITVELCPRLLDPVDKSEENYAAGLILQIGLSSAAFIIENPDQAENPNAAFLAGINGTLKAYEAVLKIYPQARWPFLDTLLKMKTSGKPDEYVREAMAKCSEVPLSDRNKTSYQAGDIVYAPIEVSRRAKILKKPNPVYALGSRMKGIQGAVLLQAVLASSGKVTDIIVINGLPGLTETAIEAARKIKFEPALKDNRSVSTAVQLEYNFQLY